MLILGMILFGMLVGAAAQLILGREGKSIDWTMAIVAGLVGSFVGGLLASLIAGDGIQLRPSGIIGSIVGAVDRHGRVALEPHPQRHPLTGHLEPVGHPAGVRGSRRRRGRPPRPTGGSGVCRPAGSRRG